MSSYKRFNTNKRLRLLQESSLRIDGFDCPILRFLCLKPVVHFPYFPRHVHLFFANFADKAERIDKAMRSYNLAVRAGWAKVEAAARLSKLAPRSYFADPKLYLSDLIANTNAVPSHDSSPASEVAIASVTTRGNSG